MAGQKVDKDKWLSIYFLIAFLIPITATVLVMVKYGPQPKLATTNITLPVIIVMMSMVHAPTIAAMIASFGENRFQGIKTLFGQLKYWRFEAKWYMRALLLFPFAISISLIPLAFFSPGFIPTFSTGVLAVGTIFSAFWEEMGWTGYATPRMLKKLSPLKTGLYLGAIHLVWHLAADIWGALNFYGNLYVLHILLWTAGIVFLRIIILWIYFRTKSLVLGWLTHFSYTGGQIFILPLALSAADTIRWNFAFVLALLIICIILVKTNKDFYGFWTADYIS